MGATYAYYPTRAYLARLLALTAGDIYVPVSQTRKAASARALAYRAGKRAGVKVRTMTAAGGAWLIVCRASEPPVGVRS